MSLCLLGLIPNKHCPPESFDVDYLELSKEIKAEVKSEKWECSVFSKSLVLPQIVLHQEIHHV